MGNQEGEGKVPEKSRRQGVEAPIGRIWKLHRRGAAGLAGDWAAQFCLGTSRERYTAFFPDAKKRIPANCLKT